MTAATASWRRFRRRLAALRFEATIRWWNIRDYACDRFIGHWLVNVEENVARCRLCGSLLFCSHATHEQIERNLLGR